MDLNRTDGNRQEVVEPKGFVGSGFKYVNKGINGLFGIVNNLALSGVQVTNKANESSYQMEKNNTEIQNK